MITELTRQDIIDFVSEYDPAPFESAAAIMFNTPAPRLGWTWWGRLDELQFLSRIYDLDALPSQDPRYQTAREDIQQHRNNNDDWDNAWPFNYPPFELETSDERLLAFLAEALHPAVRADRDEVEQIRSALNKMLRRDRHELVPHGQVSGRPIFAGGAAVPRNVQPDTLRDAIGQAIRHAMSANVVEAFCDELRMPPLPAGSNAAPMSSKAAYVCERLRSVAMSDLSGFARDVLDRHHDDTLADLLFEIELSTGRRITTAPKNLIFGSVGSKPDLILADAVHNEIKIVGNADDCLIYDRPINPDRGLSFKSLIEWWHDLHPAPNENAAARTLFTRLCEGLNSPELAIMNAYRTLLRDSGFGLPAILPQVYLHYDPKTIRQRLAVDGKQLERQRMDFLLLLPQGQRIVVELDGKEHYSSGDKPKPAIYAAMMREDRRLRLAGYEVYRFGGHEFADLMAGEVAAQEFFEELLKRHGALSK